MIAYRFQYGDQEKKVIMAGLFVKIFTDRAEKKGIDQRNACGTACGILGILLNALLGGGKLRAGLISGSVAITADAFNNLADAGSSVVTIFGFRLAAKKPDAEHPFGHGRMEYISGLAVAALILLMGYELAMTSIDKLLAPIAVSLDVISGAILAVSVLVKLYMSAYNKKYGKKIDSSAMLATSADCLSDTVSTAVVLISGIVSTVTENPYIDPICGILVALFIFKAGYGAAKETIAPLLGTPPSREFVEQIEALTLSCPLIIGIHDMVVHDYGPGRVMVSLHAEVDRHMDILTIHDAIDNTEILISQEMGCETVIHMDPIDTEDEKTAAYKAIIAEVTASFGEEIRFHDFRAVHGETHTNLLFDIVIPPDYKGDEKTVVSTIKAKTKERDPHLRCVIKVDRAYV